MDVRVFELIQGAREAQGLTVIIDVFRAFSLEAYLFDRGAESIFPVADLDIAYAMRKKDPQLLLIGERGGKMCEGFDFGNSPSAVRGLDLRGRRIVHTTSAGTQGIENAVCAQEILTGSFVIAKATADYILKKDPQTVSLVCMGNAGTSSAEEDLLCAEYIRTLLKGESDPWIDEKLLALKDTAGKKFFDHRQSEVFPEEDFWMCIKRDLFDFVIVSRKEDGVRVNRRLQKGK